MDESFIKTDALRKLTGKPFIITICSGKGGVGKSVLAANLAYLLSTKDISVLIWDADMFFPNQHLLFGVEPPIRAHEVYNGDVSVVNAIFPIRQNLSILADMPAAGINEKYKSPVIQRTYQKIVTQTDFDVIIIDAPAGASFEVVQTCIIADLVNIVITDEPTSLLDAYGLIKILLNYMEADRLALLVNNVIDFEDANDISTKLNLATENFLDLTLDVVGFIPYDRYVRQSIIYQELFVLLMPESEVTLSLSGIIDKFLKKLDFVNN